MRIVHEMDGEVQVTTSGEAYGGRVDKPPKWNGMRVDICAVVSSATGEERDVLYIEGNIDTIRKFLRQTLHQIDGIERRLQGDFEQNVADYAECSKCKCWASPRWPVHADGKGGTCYWTKP